MLSISNWLLPVLNNRCPNGKIIIQSVIARTKSFIHKKIEA